MYDQYGNKLIRRSIPYQLYDMSTKALFESIETDKRIII